MCCLRGSTPAMRNAAPSGMLRKRFSFNGCADLKTHSSHPTITPSSLYLARNLCPQVPHSPLINRPRGRPGQSLDRLAPRGSRSLRTVIPYDVHLLSLLVISSSLNTLRSIQQSPPYQALCTRYVSTVVLYAGGRLLPSTASDAPRAPIGEFRRRSSHDNRQM